MKASASTSAGQASPSGVVCDKLDDPAYTTTNINGCGGANWFTQAAEDARKTVWFLHNWRVPEIAY